MPIKFKNQKELFLHKWENAPRDEKGRPLSELSGEPLDLPLGHPYWHWQFLHVLPKGSYPHYKLRLENIMIATREEHAIQEQFSAFIDRKQELTREYYKEFYNKVF